MMGLAGGGSFPDNVARQALIEIQDGQKTPLVSPIGEGRYLAVNLSSRLMRQAMAASRFMLLCDRVSVAF
jgi:hypothetical protein